MFLRPGMFLRLPARAVAALKTRMAVISSSVERRVHRVIFDATRITNDGGYRRYRSSAPESSDPPSSGRRGR